MDLEDQWNFEGLIDPKEFGQDKSYRKPKRNEPIDLFEAVVQN